MQEKEIWKIIPNTNGNYFISNYGKVFSKNKNDILKPILKSTGYLAVTIYCDKKQKQKLIHRLVCNAFNKKIYGKTYVNHIDGKKENNFYKNLEWCTNSENWKHAWMIGLMSKEKIVTHSGNKNAVSRCVVQLTLDNKFINEYETITKAQNETGVHGSEITRCCSQKYPNRVSAGSYKWKYKK